MTQQFMVSEVKCSSNTFNPLNPERVAFWKAEFKAKRDVPAISVDSEVNLVDGRHRLAAAQELGHKTIAGVYHLRSPLDLPGRKQICDAISQASQEVLARVPFVDRRVASSIRTELGCRQNQIRLQEEDARKAEQSIVKYTGRLADFRKLLKKYQSLAAKSPQYSGLIDEMAKKIASAESDLAYHKKDLERISKILTSHKKLLAEFLAQTPGKGYPTNAEMLRDDDELKKLESEARGEPVFPTIY